MTIWLRRDEISGLKDSIPSHAASEHSLGDYVYEEKDGEGF